MKTAITGGIGSGKSYVCRLLSEYGVQVYDCDSAAKRIMRESAEVRRQLTEAIGEGAYNGNEPDKSYIASFILASDENAKLVNSVIHPAVAKDFIASGYDFMECAILYTSGFDKLVDKVVCVTAPLDVRIDRIMKRNGITKEKAQEWIDCQMSQEEVAKRSDYVIQNDGKEELNCQIEKILESVRTGRQ